MKLHKLILSIVSTTLLLSAASPKSIFETNCSSCHGKKAENSALKKSNIIQGMEVEKFVKLINGFATGEIEAAPMAKMVKKSFVKRYSAEEIKAVGEYINQLK